MIKLCAGVMHDDKVYRLTLRKKATVHQVTTMIATFKNVLFPGCNHLLIISADY